MNASVRGLGRLLALLAVGAPAFAQGAAGEASCIACHPAAARALQISAHAALLRRDDAAARSCSACHGDLAAHVGAAARPEAAARVAVPKVTAAACAACHPGKALVPADGAHPVDRLPAPGAPLPDPSQGAIERLDQQRGDDGFRWSGLVEFGYRFLHVRGSDDRYDTDVDLAAGLRVHEFESRLRGGGDAFADEFLVAGHDLGDPRWDVKGTLRKDGSYEGEAGYRRDRYLYRASGDYHRVDRETGIGDYRAEVHLSKEVRLFGSFLRADEDGFWVTQRIGDQNLGVQTFVDGVQSPRNYRSDISTLGLAGSAGEWRWSAAAEYLDDHGEDRWSYAQPAVANPAFTASEDFTSRTSLYGPGGRVALARDFGPVSIDAKARYADHARGLGASGTETGYDVSDYTTATQAGGDGSARTWLADATTTWRWTETFRLVADVHWRDHAEDFVLHQTDVTTYPTLGTATTVVTDEDQHTAQRLFDGAVELEWDAHEQLTVSLGYGYASEWLRVPDLDPSDSRDFRSGSVRDQGVVAALDWRFAPGWKLRGDVRDFGQDGVYLHELAPEQARVARGTLGYIGKEWRGSTFVRHRFVDNHVSDHRLDAFATGLHGGVTRGALSLDADYTFARTDTQTLTNFYFDPDPNPQPTYVGFDGQTHTVAATLGIEPSQGVRCEFRAVWTDTLGSIDLGTMDWRAGCRCDLTRSGAAGVEFRQIRYREDGSPDNYDARMVWLYWRQSF